MEPPQLSHLVAQVGDAECLTYRRSGRDEGREQVSVHKVPGDFYWEGSRGLGMTSGFLSDVKRS